MKAIFAIDLARCGKLKAGEDVIQFKHQGRALMVIALNAIPFVLVDQTVDPAPGYTPLQVVSRVEFVPEPRSGTDMQRARIHAGLFLESLAQPPMDAPSPGPG